uniref:Putative conserved secreted protein n=1 Tax=Amblyomma tuberculatum TaxID=48802 RepID=A0A6M2E1L5_9ACAR
MRFQAAVLVAIATVFVAEWRLCAGYVSIGKVPVENGKCLYNGTQITPGEPLLAEFPCEEWDCTSEGDLTITGCGAVSAGRDCIALKGTGVYPRCCEQIACH